MTAIPNGESVRPLTQTHPSTNTSSTNATERATNMDNNEETEPAEVEHECIITGDYYPESTMRQIASTVYGRTNLQRRNRWIASNPDQPISACPWDEPTMVWVYEGIEVSYCSSCEEPYDTDDCESINEIEVGPCCSDHYSYCDPHDSWYHTSDGYCSACDDEDYEDEYGSSLIHDYSYRPSPVFFVMRDGSVRRLLRPEPAKSFTGFELEMEASVGCSVADGAQVATDLYGDSVYLKYDGSLDSGFEMVSHPMGLDYLNDSFNWDGVRELAQMGMRSAKTSTCGLHVHINKSFFRGHETVFYRFMAMFYRNPDMWRRLAGRSDSGYAKWDIANESPRMLAYAKSLGVNPYDRAVNHDRYVAVNMQPSNTIELRFFKGTLRPETLKARVTGIHAVAQFVMSSRYSLALKECGSWEAFRNFTNDNDAQFSAFNNYATTKGV